MPESICCENQNWMTVRDLGHADSFDFILGKCTACGIYSINVFCVSTSKSGLEPVIAADLNQLLAIPSGQEMKAFMKDWAHKNL
jgi:hypothetical protein